MQRSAARRAKQSKAKQRGEVGIDSALEGKQAASNGSGWAGDREMDLDVEYLSRRATLVQERYGTVRGECNEPLSRGTVQSLSSKVGNTLRSESLMDGWLCLALPCPVSLQKKKRERREPGMQE